LSTSLFAAEEQDFIEKSRESWHSMALPVEALFLDSDDHIKPSQTISSFSSYMKTS
jgi:hypothetical protein